MDTPERVCSDAVADIDAADAAEVGRVDEVGVPRARWIQHGHERVEGVVGGWGRGEIREKREGLALVIIVVGLPAP